jgi:Cu/Ag efflux pump CusA
MLRCLRILGYGTRSGVEYGGAYAGQQQSFPGLVLVVLPAVVLVLLFECFNLSVPIAALASIVFSRSEVVLAVPVARTTFIICSLTGLMRVMGVAAENEILPLNPDQRLGSRDSLQKSDTVQGPNRKKKGASAGNEVLAMGRTNAVARGAGAQVLQPRARAAIGGLLMATVRRSGITAAVFFATDRNSYSNPGSSIHRRI